MRLVLSSLMTAFALATLLLAHGIVQADDVAALQKQTVSDKAGSFVAPDQLNGALFGIARNEKWEPQANDEVSRGIGTVIYAKAGPAVVVVRVGQGHGTGFLIDKEGWIITNRHVAVMGMLDLASGGLVAKVYFGRYQDRLMTLDRQPYLAAVYKLDEERDLALLRLIQKPSYLDEIEAIALAEENGAPGDDCIAIGHPSAGLLWTLRTGEVTGVGNWPQEHIAEVMASLASAGVAGGQAKQSLSGIPKRRVLLSTCGINPGDSGGPLLNEQGELIGVTFGIPRRGADQQISLDKFSYHVHRDELKAFLEQRPEKPQIVVPEPWPPALFGNLQDTDGDGHWDKWSFSLKQGGNLTGLMFDLDQDTKPAFKEEYVTDAGRRKEWDFEFAFRFTPFIRAFYDTDNDGAVDLILTDVNKDGTADLVIQFKDQTWQRIDAAKQPILDATLFADKQLQERMAKFLE